MRRDFLVPKAVPRAYRESAYYFNQFKLLVAASQHAKGNEKETKLEQKGLREGKL